VAEGLVGGLEGRAFEGVGVEDGESHGFAGRGQRAHSIEF
jgi:hypothetical protein